MAVKLAEFFCYDRCTVLVLGTGDPNVIYVAAASDEPSLTRWPLDLRKYPELRAVLDGREPVYIGDVAASPLLGDVASSFCRWSPSGGPTGCSGCARSCPGRRRIGRCCGCSR